MNFGTCYVCVKTHIHLFIYIVSCLVLILLSLLQFIVLFADYDFIIWLDSEHKDLDKKRPPSSPFHSHFVLFLTCKSVKSQVLPWLMKPLRLQTKGLIWCCNKIWNWIKLPPHLPVHEQQAATKGPRRKKEWNEEKMDSTHKDTHV